eukprot:scaffold206533_cov30-Tisochrysis_lutea.AAC.1
MQPFGLAPFRQAGRTARVTLPLEAFTELADFASQREREVAWRVELIPVAHTGECGKLMTNLFESQCRVRKALSRAPAGLR